MKAPLYNRLIEYSSLKTAFHMPGHKFGSIAGLNQMNIAILDNTETIGMDNLYEAEGIIKEAMELMAEFYGARHSIFLTNGSTVGILSSVLATCREGDQLIVARNAHHSVWSALVLAGVSPIYISPKYLVEEDILGEISAITIERALEQYPAAKGVLIVSPTYEGVVSDIKAIAEVVHKHNKILIVDEAHGAHFVLEDGFPTSSIKNGADIVINSMHKTLPALTQSALLHICSEKISYEQIIEALRMVQTSSPSYVMMGLMDYIRAYIVQNKSQIKHNYIECLIEVRRNLISNLNNLRLIECSAERYDISKIIISTHYTNIKGYDLADILDKKFDIIVEAALENYIILMTTMADTHISLMKLQEALLKIDMSIQKSRERKAIKPFIIDKISLGENPRKIFYSQKEYLEINQCTGYISTKNIMLYPPGIPIVAIGERITEQNIDFINKFKDRLQGIKLGDNKILIEITK